MIDYSFSSLYISRPSPKVKPQYSTNHGGILNNTLELVKI